MPSTSDSGPGRPPAAVRAEATGFRGWVQRWLTLLDGEMAAFPEQYRHRVVEWQERRTHFALQGLMWLFALFTATKAALVLAGIWQVATPGWAYLVLLAVIVGAALAFRRSHTLATEAVVALSVLVAVILVSFDPIAFVRGQFSSGLGLVVLLPAIGIPVLVLLRSAVVLALVCAAVGVWFLIHSGWSMGWKIGFVLNLALSIAAGMMLRVYRANMSVGFIRSMEAAIMQATTDSLTGVMNRQGWFTAAENALEDVQASGRSATLLFMDLDDFKKLNDTHGHAIGDEVLRRTGQVLGARMNAGAVAARIGGEEFVCLLPGQTPDQARRLAERLAADLRTGPYPATFSAGVAESEPGITLSELMARADAAMYAAKQRGRDQVM